MKRKIFSNFFLCFSFLSLGFSEGPQLHEKFVRLSPQIKRLEEDNQLIPMILERKKEIESIKWHWKQKIIALESPAFLHHLQTLLDKVKLTPSEDGCGRAYILEDERNIPRYLIKPFDEETFCLNNRKDFASPYHHCCFRIRDPVPLYRSAQAEKLAYSLAKLLGFSHLTPQTHLAVLSHPAFFDFTDRLDNNDPLSALLGPADREKFCSVQVFHEGMQNLYSFVEENANQDQLIEMTDFEDLCLFIWLIHDTDAHPKNFYIKKEQGRYRLLKIDNGLAFPERNSHLINGLYFFPQAKQPLSERTKRTIKNLPLVQIKELFILYELKDAYKPFLERVQMLKNLAEHPNISIRGIENALRKLEMHVKSPSPHHPTLG